VNIYPSHNPVSAYVITMCRLWVGPHHFYVSLMDWSMSPPHVIREWIYITTTCHLAMGLVTATCHLGMGSCHCHMLQYGRSMKRGKKLKIGNNIKKLNVGFVELRECGGK
jgi:hypothetical protein